MNRNALILTKARSGMCLAGVTLDGVLYTIEVGTREEIIEWLENVVTEPKFAK